MTVLKLRPISTDSPASPAASDVAAQAADREAPPAPAPAPSLSPVDPDLTVTRGSHRRTDQWTTAIAATVATVVIAVAAPGNEVESSGLVFMVYLLAGVAVGRPPRWSAMLPLTRSLVRVMAPVAASLVLLVLAGMTSLLAVSWWSLIAAMVATELTTAYARRRATVVPTRIAIVGSPRSAERLRAELRHSGAAPHVVVGVIVSDRDLQAFAGQSPQPLGGLSSLAQLIGSHRVDLLLIDHHASMVEVFDHLADSCLHLPVRVCDLTHFYEDTLGRVPVSEIDSAWFRCIMDPRFRSPDNNAKRAMDIVVSVIALLVFSPVIVLAAVLIKLHDRGPVLFAQRRIGSHGEDFTLLKLRTMSVQAPVACWSSAHDPRVTPIGRRLRRTHLDELPQLLNVLRGDMTVVGPRPEQPEFVERLEAALPHYNRRHLIKPGLTGWAQVRCGYAGSDSGSAWKLCHDLFYLRHRSLGLDLAILVETLHTLVADRQFPAHDVMRTNPAPPPALIAAEGVAFPASTGARCA